MCCTHSSKHNTSISRAQELQSPDQKATCLEAVLVAKMAPLTPWHQSARPALLPTSLFARQLIFAPTCFAVSFCCSLV